MPISITQVDAFTDQPYRGNPAAVCILQEPREDAWMRHVAAEMNLSETAFLLREDGGFRLRWFTPAVEVDLCGHATLASAHVLWEQGHIVGGEPARFHTRSGLLTAVKSGGWIEMDFPATPPAPAPAPPGLAEALGVEPIYAGRSRFDLLVEIESPEQLRRLAPDFAALARADARGIIVTSRSGVPEFDFLSRFFAPAVGINEDPVTGSSHCCLGPYWTARLGKNDLLACQVSARQGIVRVRTEGDRVHLGGQAVTVLHAELLY